MRYVKEFLSLKCAPLVLETVGNLGNKPAKEISESMTIIKKLKKIIIPKPNNHYVLMDLCAGNALTSVLASHLFKLKFSYAIDKKERIRNWKITKNFIYLKDDINNISFDILPYKEIILISSHPCQLATKIVDIYNNVPYIKALVMIPCCEGIINYKPSIKRIEATLGKYEAWSASLADSCKGNVSLHKDNHCLSPKNLIITAQK